MSNKGNPYFGATFAERKAYRLGNEGEKAVHSEDVEDKAVTSSATKTARKPRKATARKKG